MNKYTAKILYLLDWLYELTEEDKKNIIESLEKIKDEDKIEIAYILHKRYEAEKAMFKEAEFKIKIVDHNIIEYNEKKEADIWLENILTQLEDKKI